MKLARRRAALAAASLAIMLPLSGCLRPSAIHKAAEALAPGARALLGPEIGRVVTLLQSRGAIAVERHYAGLFEAAKARAETGKIAGAPALQAAHDKAVARMKLLERLRAGNDYSQRAQALPAADRAALEAARAETDAAFAAARSLLAGMVASAPS